VSEGQIHEAGGHGLLFDGKFTYPATLAHGFVDSAIGATTDKSNDSIAVVDTFFARVAIGGHIWGVGAVWNRPDLVSKDG
jgi:hypothetical protein